VNADPIEAGYATEPPYGAPALPPFDPVFVAAIEAVSDGETTARIVKGTTLERLGGGRFAPHVLAGSDGRWSVVDGACPTRVSSVFLANGELYVAWAEGTEVLWAPLE